MFAPDETLPPAEAVPRNELADPAAQPDVLDALEAQDGQGEQFGDGGTVPPHVSASEPDDVFAAAPAFESAPAADFEPHTAPAAQQQPHDAQAANPSLAELEDELFPLPAEEKDHDAQPDSSVFVSGGFLPGSGNG